MIQYKITASLVGTQVEEAASLIAELLNEENFWSLLGDYFSRYDMGEHPLLTDDKEILAHIKFMFHCKIIVKIASYKTRNPWSSTIGHAKLDTVFENIRKLGDLSLSHRVGHIGHETVHLFGYGHDYQGQETSPAVLFGTCMSDYAQLRIG